MTDNDAQIEAAARAMLDLSERSVAMGAQRPTAREWEEARYVLRAALALPRAATGCNRCDDYPPGVKCPVCRRRAPNEVEVQDALASLVQACDGLRLDFGNTNGDYRIALFHARTVLTHIRKGQS